MDVLQQAVLTAEEAEKDLKYTMSCVSHDIRTPLTGAAGYMQLLERTQDPDKREKILPDCQTEAWRIWKHFWRSCFSIPD